ncbi:MAG: hypothetical protein AVDCRST_MAG57-3099, partial [uncultured Blastococcus sp.]
AVHGQQRCSPDPFHRRDHRADRLRGDRRRHPAPRGVRAVRGEPGERARLLHRGLAGHLRLVHEGPVHALGPQDRRDHQRRTGRDRVGGRRHPAVEADRAADPGSDRQGQGVL